MTPITDKDGAGIDAILSEFFDFTKKAFGIKNNAVAYDIDASRTQHAGWNQMQGVFPVADDHRMSRVVAPLPANDHIRLIGKIVYYFSFSFISPLGSYNCQTCHNQRLLLVFFIC